MRLRKGKDIFEFIVKNGECWIVKKTDYSDTKMEVDVVEISSSVTTPEVGNEFYRRLLKHGFERED